MNTIPGMGDFAREDGNEELWYQVFQEGHPVLLGKQKRFSMLPGRARCKLCRAPLTGIGGWITRRIGLEPSSRNPFFCNACDGFLQAFPGGAEVDLSILFCDLRDSVPLSAAMSPKEFKQLITFMRETIIPVLWQAEGFVLQFQGDAVIGVWPPGFSGKDYARKAVTGGMRLPRALESNPFNGRALPVGIALHTGRAYLGTVASVNGNMQEVSAFGFDVNVAARLAAAANAGEVLISEAALKAAGRTIDEAELRSYDLKGIDDEVRAARLLVS
ncbi:adenylate/guanylate cyclase domain-containing protein [Halovulum dunhuangense]|uniref:Adenylate/guanylate cyclase domain-containing protein n=1 Tax=Halovulum dunhuangense TaxID=1505036 RepID=A0A849L0W0_9RHOB|nr:adenylate/guanylate cyclase domain-containing protein [Halovulum dunhuangense]NNU79916.1 adenylate/guanylate cyclase domain-containing protein [Halovulum dunhuangense]